MEIVSLESRHRDRAEFYILDADGKYAAVPVNEQGLYTSAMLPG